MTDGAELSHLLAAVGAGCATSLREVYDRTSAKLFGIIIMVLNDRGESEDVLQDVYLTVWRKAANFDRSRASPMTWLIVIARNRAIDCLRKRAKPATMFDIAPHVADLAPLADTLIERDEEVREISRALATLRPAHAEAIRDIYYSGLSYNELSLRDGITLPTLRSWVRRGLLQMRSILDIPAYYEAPPVNQSDGDLLPALWERCRRHDQCA